MKGLFGNADVLDVGVTGTQEGCTTLQRKGMRNLLHRLLADKNSRRRFRHGDCVGVDAEAHSIVRRAALADIYIHPCNIQSKRAFCKGAKFVYTEKHPLSRNKDIVDAIDILVVCPKTMEEEIRSGTWATYRYAKQCGKQIYIVWPDGTVKGPM